METKRVVTMPDVQEALTPFYIKTSQVFYLSLVGGVLVFFVIDLWLYLQTSDLSLAANIELVRLLSFTHLFYALAGYPVSLYLFERLFTRKHVHGAPAMTPDGILIAIRLASIVRLAIMEGIAFLGLVICFIGAQSGILHRFPEYWLNSLSSIILIGFVVFDFPTRERLERICRTRVFTASEV